MTPLSCDREIPRCSKCSEPGVPVQTPKGWKIIGRRDGRLCCAVYAHRKIENAIEAWEHLHDERG